MSVVNFNKHSNIKNVPKHEATFFNIKKEWNITIS